MIVSKDGKTITGLGDHGHVPSDNRRAHEALPRAIPDARSAAVVASMRCHILLLEKVDHAGNRDAGYVQTNRWR
jgi:hypothetical protein